MPTDNNCILSLGMQNTEDKLSLPDGLEVGVMLPDWVTARGAPLALYIKVNQKQGTMCKKECSKIIW